MDPSVSVDVILKYHFSYSTHDLENSEADRPFYFVFLFFYCMYVCVYLFICFFAF